MSQLIPALAGESTEFSRLRSHRANRDGISLKSRHRAHNFKNLRPQSTCMAKTVVKRVQLTDEEAELLATLAESTSESESSILREGLRLVSRMKKRADNIHLLLELSDIGDDSYVKWEGKP